MKKISLIVMSCIMACGLLANHGIVRGGEMSPKVEDTVSIAKKITDSQCNVVGSTLATNLYSGADDGNRTRVISLED